MFLRRLPVPSCMAQPSTAASWGRFSSTNLYDGTGCQPPEAPTGQGFPVQNSAARMASASVSSWCVTGSLTVNWQGPPQKSRVVGFGDPGARGDCAARHVDQGTGPKPRQCSPPRLAVLQNCPGPEHQTQACFMAA